MKTLFKAGCYRLTTTKKTTKGLKMEQLKEHRLFRNQLIIATIIMIVVGVSMSIGGLIAFGIVFGLIALFNIYTYNENVKDYNKLNSRK
jgi:hypothetical protein